MRFLGRLFGWLRPRRTVPDVMRIVKSGDVESVSEGLQSTDSTVRWMAALAGGALVRAGEQGAIEAIVPVFQDEDAGLRGGVARMIGDCAKDARARAVIEGSRVLMILEEMSEKDPDDIVRREAKQALRKFRESAPTQQNFGFGRHPATGICDVCSQAVGPGEAYLVPADIFYASSRYREWLTKSPVGQMGITIAGSVDAFIAHSRSIDPTSHSAVCPKCIHMFP